MSCMYMRAQGLGLRIRKSDEKQRADTHTMYIMDIRGTLRVALQVLMYKNSRVLYRAKLTAGTRRRVWWCSS